MKSLTVGKDSMSPKAGIIGKRREHMFYTGMAIAVVYLGRFVNRCLAPAPAGDRKHASLALVCDLVDSVG
jgi:hypothetical protein